MAKQKKSNRSLGEMLRQAREDRGWSQTELAEMMGISAGTVHRTETGGTKPGLNVLVGLAVAFNEDPEEWIEKAGRPPLNKDELAQLVDKARKGMAGSGRSSGVPFEAFITEMGKDLSQLKPKLICVCYMSRPSAIRRADILRQITLLIPNGLHLAMFCPYPVVSNELSQSNYCARHYSDIMNDVSLLWHEYMTTPVLRAHNLTAEKRIKMFYPKQEDVLFMPPPTTFGLRPMLIVPKPGATDSDCHLGCIVDLPFDNEPRWYDIHTPGAICTEQVALMLKAWHAYFDPAIRAWQGLDSWDIASMNKSTSWRKREPAR